MREKGWIRGGLVSRWECELEGRRDKVKIQHLLLCSQTWLVRGGSTLITWPLTSDNIIKQYVGMNQVLE